MTIDRERTLRLYPAIKRSLSRASSLARCTSTNYAIGENQRSASQNQIPYGFGVVDRLLFQLFVALLRHTNAHVLG